MDQQGRSGGERRIRGEDGGGSPHGEHQQLLRRSGAISAPRNPGVPHGRSGLVRHRLQLRGRQVRRNLGSARWWLRPTGDRRTRIRVQHRFGRDLGARRLLGNYPVGGGQGIDRPGRRLEAVPPRLRPCAVRHVHLRWVTFDPGRPEGHPAPCGGPHPCGLHLVSGQDRRTPGIDQGSRPGDRRLPRRGECPARRAREPGCTRSHSHGPRLGH